MEKEIKVKKTILIAMTIGFVALCICSQIIK